MEKVLVLTCSTGEGHNSAARAIETALTENGIVWEQKDPVSFQSERMKRLVASLYNDTIRKAPAVFGAVYKLGDIYCASKLPSPVYWANAHYSPTLKKYIIENKFDAVICTHLYGMEAMTAIRKDEDFNVPCYGVLTDYVCIPFTEETDLTAFFVPNQEAVDYLVRKGIPREKLKITGIPVNSAFARHVDRNIARKQLEIPEDRHVFLIMTGGVGCENMEQLVGQLYDTLKEKDLMIVMTGRNDKLKKRLDEEFPDSDKIRTVAFTDQVPSYMAASDVLLSKPGGLSTTEAAVANIPIVHIHAIPGCETFNARYFDGHGMSLWAQNDVDAVLDARMLADNPDAASEMKAIQRKLINPEAADEIVREVSCS